MRDRSRSWRAIIFDAQRKRVGNYSAVEPRFGRRKKKRKSVAFCLRKGNSWISRLSSNIARFDSAKQRSNELSCSFEHDDAARCHGKNLFSLIKEKKSILSKRPAGETTIVPLFQTLPRRNAKKKTETIHRRFHLEECTRPIIFPAEVFT